MISRGKYSGTKEWILSLVSEAEIASYYIPQLRMIPEVISSPLRKDEHPSFRIYSPDGQKVRYYDYATQDKGGIIDLIMRLYGCTYEETLERIYLDLVKNNGRKPAIPQIISTTPSKTIREEYSTIVRTQMRKWEEYDFEYWDSYGVPRNWLEHADIYPISFIFLVFDNGYIKTIKADKYAYTFIERKEGRITEKVYQPFNQNGYKWRSGHDKSVWDLWTKLPKKGKTLIITSSRKDALCIWAQTGIPSICLQSETTSVNPKVIDELKERFKKIFILYDNDFTKERNVGRIDGMKLAEEFKIEQIEIPEVYKCKDTSDLYHTYGGDTVRKIIYYLTRKTNNYA